MLLQGKARSTLTIGLVKCFISEDIKLKKTNLCEDIFGGEPPSSVHATLPSRISSKSLASDSLILCSYI